MNNIKIHILKNNRGHVEFVLIPFKDKQGNVESYKVRIEVREYGQDGRGTAKDSKGQLKSVQYFLNISEALRLAEQIGTFNLKTWDTYSMKDPKDSSNQLTFPTVEMHGGRTKGRKIQIQLTQLKSGTRFKFKVVEGEAVKNKTGGTTIKAGTELTAENYQSINDTVEAFLSLKMFLQALANAEVQNKTFRIWEEIKFTKQHQAEPKQMENKGQSVSQTTNPAPKKDESLDAMFKDFDGLFNG